MKASVSYRIAPDLWLEEKRFAELLDALLRHPGCCDEVALFSSFTHSVLALPELQRRARVMRDRFAVLRRAGFRAGVNPLTTIGHHAENLATAATGFTPLTGIDGATEPGTCCPNDPAFQAQYLVPAFTALAEAEPDFIWLDDDIRFNGHGALRLVCFCDRCMERFRQRVGRNFTRATLHRALNLDPERAALRRAWLEFSGETMRELFGLVETIVHGVDPAIELGAMDATKRVGDLAGFEELAAALAGDPPRPVRWRPGGGAYTDYRLLEEVVRGKAMQIGAECALLPPSVTTVQAEIESFNYQRLRKSLRATALEAATYIAAGADGVAWNILDGGGDFASNRPVIAETARIRPFLDVLADSNRNQHPVGVWNGWTPRAALIRRSDDTDWCLVDCPDVDPHATELFAAGIPAAYRLEEAEVTMLIGPAAEWLSEDELRTVFSRGVYCDVATLRILERRHLAHWAGFRPSRRIEADALERFLPHPLNAAAAGFQRDGRLSFVRWFGADGGAWALENPDGRGVALADLVDYQGRTVAPCCLGTYENELGGRVAVAGYYPTENLLFPEKLAQLKRLFSWLAADRLSAWVRSYAAIALWVRRDAAGSMSVALVNASCDDRCDLEVAVRTPCREARFTAMTGEGLVLSGQADETEGVTIFTVPELAAWRAGLLEVR